MCTICPGRSSYSDAVERDASHHSPPSGVTVLKQRARLWEARSTPTSPLCNASETFQYAKGVLKIMLSYMDKSLPQRNRHQFQFPVFKKKYSNSLMLHSVNVKNFEQRSQTRLRNHSFHICRDSPTLLTPPLPACSPSSPSNGNFYQNTMALSHTKSHKTAERRNRLPSNTHILYPNLTPELRRQICSPAQQMRL